MTRVSSNWTILLKLAIPTMWIVFFGVVEIVILLYGILPFIAAIISVITYLIGVLVLKLTLLRLKRVECDETYLYVTNYLKTYRYTYDSIAGTRTTNLMVLDLVSVTFRDKTSFGKKIYFVKRPQVWAEQKLIHPELAQPPVKGATS